MCKRLIYFSLFVMLIGYANTAGQELVGWWPLDDGAGTTAVDSSGNGNDGTINGTPTWVAGKFDGALQFNGTNCYINCGNGASLNEFTNQITISFWLKTPAFTTTFSTVISKGDGAWRMGRGGNGTGNVMHMGLTGNNYFDGTKVVTDNEWHFCAGVYDGTTATIYVDGVADTTNTATVQIPSSTYDVLIGSNAQYLTRYLSATLDDVRLYKRALTVDELQLVMAGAGSTKGLAKNPQPKNNSTDVSIDVGEISWTHGEYVSTDGGTHNVFLGTDKASVTNATIAEPLGTSVYEGLDVNNVALDRLEYGTTYYWRVDEVNIPSKPGTATGKIWSFTTELEGYPLEPAKIVNVTASENPVYPDEQEPNMTCNESGLDANDLHSTLLATMWLGMADEPGQVWIQYEFDRVYKLHDMLVWNYNELPPSEAYGAKDVNIAYSLDGETWTALGDTVTFNQAPGDETCTANTAVDFDGAVAKYVKLTFWSSFEDGLYTGGVSEVRFSAMPTRAAEPDPEDEDTDIAVDAVLGWKAGRDAVEHNLYIDTDVNAVKEGTVSMIGLQDASYAPVLELAKTYYWKVDEVNMAEEYTTWDGDVWSFSTVQAIVVDNFEVDYDDTDANAVWATWIDGYGNESVNGALMGYEFPGPYLSTTNVNGGHSAPIRYNNTTAGYSEVKAQSEELPIGTVDWSLGSPKTLTIWFRGDPCNVVGDEELYCVVDGKRVVYGGDIANLGRNRWSQFDIDLSALGVNLSDVDDIAIGIKKIGAAGGSGVLLIDYIRLTGLDPVIASKSIWIEAENVTTKGKEVAIYTEWSDTWALNDTTSGTGFIRDVNATKDATNEPNSLGIVTYNFTLTEGGQYTISARLIAGFNSTTYQWQDSYWARVTGANVTTNVPLNANGWALWDNIPNGFTYPVGYVWSWDPINNTSGGQSQDLIWTLPAGTYTLQIAYRQRGARIDVFEIIKVGN